MRIAGLVLVVSLGAAAALGCKSKGDSEAAPDPQQQDLIARRDALMAARTKLQSERDSVEAQIKDTEAKGGDTADLVKKKQDLDSQIESQTSDLLSIVNSKLDALKLTGDRSMAAREAELASRERSLADREARVAEREHQLIQRDADLAQRWKDTCSAGPPVIIQQTASKGGSYTKKDVSDLIARAKAAMAKKGLITSDLGSSANLESEAGKALNDNDMSKAYFAAAQLTAAVDAIAVNRPFIQAKTARLQGELKSRSGKLDDATNQELAQILGDVMQKYNDGDFIAANRRLNQLAYMMGK